MSVSASAIFARIGVRLRQLFSRRKALWLVSLLMEAAFVTLIAVAAHYLHVFDAVDQSLYARVSGVLDRGIGTITSARSVVVKIDQATFDGPFSGTTPLAREPLSDLLGALIAEGREIAVDFDLSPRGPAIEEFRKAFTGGELSCKSLNKLQQQASWPIESRLCGLRESNAGHHPATEAGDVAGAPADGDLDEFAHVRLVALVPFPSSHNDAIVKFNWMQLMCAIGDESQAVDFDFAFADIPNPPGPYAVTYFSHGATLAGALAESSKAGICNDLLEPDRGAGSWRDALPFDYQFLDRNLYAIGRDALHSGHIDAKHPKLLDFRIAPDVIELSSCWNPDLDPGSGPMSCAGQIARQSAPGAAIFLGGSWDSYGADEFLSPLGRISGVELHAIAYEGEVPHVNIVETLLIEFVVGVLLILLFHRTWARAEHSLQAFDKAAGWRESALPALAYLWQIVLIPLTVAVLSLLIIASAAVVLSAYKWIAPTALLVTLLAKTLLEHEEYKTNNFSTYCLGRLPFVAVCLTALLILV